ncbi:MAG TPA: cell division protein FtsQ [Cyclobacteriaceae bacterium]
MKKFNLKIRNEVKIAVVIVGLFFLIAFGERKQSGVVCTNIVIEVENAKENHFLDESDVLKIIESSGEAVIGESIEEINLRVLENKLENDKHISNAEIFGDVKGNLTVNIVLRRPIARLIREDGPDAYIAEDGKIMETSGKFAARIVLISGSVVKPLIQQGDLHLSEGGEQLIEMIEFINRNQFWKAQVAQLDFNKTGKVFIYPQVTGQVVEFGKPEDIELKFQKLMIFYKEVLPQMGWTKYERINVEYEGQVIAE